MNTSWTLSSCRVISDVITAGMVVGKVTSISTGLIVSLPSFKLGIQRVAGLSGSAGGELHDEAAPTPYFPNLPLKDQRFCWNASGFIWSRLSLLIRLQQRNIFRYKQRMLMTILELQVQLLLFAGLGIQSSVGGVVERQFEQIQQYQMIVAEKSSEEQEKADLETALAG